LTGCYLLLVLGIAFLVALVEGLVPDVEAQQMRAVDPFYRRVEEKGALYLLQKRLLFPVIGASLFSVVNGSDLAERDMVGLESPYGHMIVNPIGNGASRASPSTRPSIMRRQ
jgi:hypothetical protein